MSEAVEQTLAVAEERIASVHNATFHTAQSYGALLRELLGASAALRAEMIQLRAENAENAELRAKLAKRTRPKTEPTKRAGKASVNGVLPHKETATPEA